MGVKTRKFRKFRVEWQGVKIFNVDTTSIKCITRRYVLQFLKD